MTTAHDEHNWSGSETASLSDTDGNDNRQFLTECQDLFDCTNKMEFSFLMKGFFEKLMGDVFGNVSNEDEILIFDESFSLQDSEERSELFKTIRFSLYQILNSVASSSSYNNLVFSGFRKQLTIKSARFEITKFLMHLTFAIKWLNDVNNTEYLLGVVNEFGSLLNSIGNIYQQPRWVDRASTNSACFHLFHLRLQMKVQYFIFLAKVQTKAHISSATNQLFDNLTTNMVQDLLISSNMTFSQIKNRQGDISREDMYKCHCIKETWVIIIHVLKWLSEKFVNKSFWMIVTQQLTENGDNMSSLEKRWSFSWITSDEFKIWILVSLSQLHWTSINGKDTFNEKKVVPDNWLLVQDILQKNLNPNLVEKHLKIILWGCIRLSQHWSPNADICKSLLDYFYVDITNKTDRKQRRKSFQPIANYMHGSEEFDCRYKIHVMKGLSNVITSVPDDEDPFDVFLRFVAMSVKKASNIDSSQTISQMKQRIYSKFHKRCLTDLDQEGLTKFCQLLYVISLNVDTSDVPHQLSSRLGQIDCTQKPVKFKKYLIFHYFTILDLCKEKSLTTEQVINRIVLLFKDIVCSLAKQKSPKEQYQQNVNLLGFYLQSVEQYYEGNVCQVEDLGLISTIVYKKLFQILPEKFSNMVHKHISQLIIVFINNHEDRRTDAYRLFYETFYEYLINQLHSHGDKVMEIFADIAVLGLLSDNREVEDLISKYSFNESVTLSGRCAFLAKLTSLDPFKAHIEKSNASKKLISTWIECILSGLETRILTKNIIRLPELTKYLRNVDTSELDEVAILIKLIEGMAQDYSNALTPMDAMPLKTAFSSYFSSFIPTVGPILSEATDVVALKRVFDVASCLVRRCSKALYSKTSPNCLLPKIIDSFVLPLYTPKKPLPEKRREFMVKYLHLFLNGISSMDLKRDGFISRRIKDILHRYFNILTLAHYKKELEKNPILVSLIPSCSNEPTQQASDYRALVLNHIKMNCMNLPQDRMKLSSVLYFILQVISYTKSETELCESLKIFLDKVLCCILTCDMVKKTDEPPHIRDLAKNILKNISKLQTYSSHQMVSKELENFVRSNITKYRELPLKTLKTVCIASPPAVKNVYKQIERLVEKDERGRGSGNDASLRYGLEELSSLIKATNTS